MSPLQYETYLQIADEALAEAIVSGPAPVVHRYRLSVGDEAREFRGDAAAEAGGSAGRIVRLRHQERQGVPHLEHVGAEQGHGQGQASLGPGTLAPSAIRRFGEAAVQMPERCFAFGFHQAFRKGETRIKVRAARVEPAEGADASRLPILDGRRSARRTFTASS